MGPIITETLNKLFGWVTTWLTSVIVDVLTQLLGTSV
jgi:hypothetical protein